VADSVCVGGTGCFHFHFCSENGVGVLFRILVDTLQTTQCNKPGDHSVKVLMHFRVFERNVTTVCVGELFRCITFYEFDM
jgi:hypothetical protein